MEKEYNLEILLKKLGDFGRYQRWQYLLHCLASLTAGINMVSLVTVAAVPDHRCEIPGENGTMLHRNDTILLKYIPYLDDKNKFDSCSIYNQTTNLTDRCQKFVYDDTYYKSSRSIEWNFVCDRRWMGAVAQSVYMFGVFTGAIVCGNLADKYGRKPVFCWSAVLQLIFGVGVAFTPEFLSFLVVRFFYGIFGTAGCYIPAFVLTMELVGPSKRSICGLSIQVVFAIGMMLVAAWGAVIPDRKLLQILYGAHAILLIPHIWVMDESITWLWSNGRKKEAGDILKKAFKINRKPINLDFAKFVNKVEVIGAETKKEDAGLSDLFKSSRLRIMTLNVCLSWFACSLVYYGLSLNTGSMKGNPFVNLFLIALVEVPAYIISAFVMDKLGRRPIVSCNMILGSICCIIAAVLSSGTTLSTILVMSGKFLISSAFAVIYNYSAELFPTVVRNSAVGLGSMAARLSGALTPLISLLDSFDPKLPAIVFALVALVSGFLTLFLPETLHKKMPQTIEDGERFGIGDKCFTTCINNKMSSEVSLNQAGTKLKKIDNPEEDENQPLNRH